ncbi:MAG: NAD(P)/FAD-dependent oxidoreductase [Clostridia bacterium]|jgi:thioredoxin reductase (NADPH)
MYDVIVIGKGPAGIQAAIYLGRAGFDTVIISKDSGSLGKAEYIENYYGFSKPIKASDLLNEGIEQAKRFNVQFIDDEVIKIGQTDNKTISVEGLKKEYTSSYAVIASGMARKSINVPGLKEFEGKGISYCVMCDGFFFRNKKTAVIGYTKFAEHELNDLMLFTKDIVLLTNGKEIQFDLKGYENVKVIDIPIKEIYGDESVKGIMFTDGSKEEIYGIFIAYGTADSTSFTIKSGIATEKNLILIDMHHMTNIDRVYAAGDCTGTLMQVAVAAGEGAKTAKTVIERLKTDRKK